MNTSASGGTNEPIQPFEFKSLNELFSTPEEVTPFCVEDLLPSSGLSVLVGKPKAGKSTLARQLAVAVARGKDFLGRATEQGGVLYLAMEEKASEIAAHFRRLGAQHSDPLYTVCGAVAKNQAVSKLEAALQSRPEVKLAIIDPIFKFIVVRDSNDYVPVNNALEQLLTLARKYEVHIIAVHHMKKRETDDPMDGALGSTAIAAGVDTYIALKTKGNGKRTLCTRQRYGIDMAETELVWNAEIRGLTLGVTCDEAETLAAEETRVRIERDMVLYVSRNSACTQQGILAAVRGNVGLKKQTLQKLIDSDLLLQSGSGVKGEPYTYRVAPVPAENSTQERESEHREVRSSPFN
jgi:RecA-family ATPase